ncbi:MAG TPA: hypothetical protein VL096_21630, partial [Pirellulaceae bacterium]|nr:hypothetical protein [Pirellulaceae bacterium]
AGVPFFVNIAVRNHGNQAAKRVQVKVRSNTIDASKYNPAAPEANLGESEELPVVLIDEIPPGELVTQRVQIYFPIAGQHVISATLPEDAVAADNRRYAVVDFPDGEPVLVIDGHAKGRNAYYLNSAFQPGARANTGVRPDVQPPEFLRDVTAETLNKYRVIYLLDVPRLDPRGVTNLEAFVQGGGGLAFFVGPNVNLAFYNNSLYKNGSGLFPVPLDREDELLPDAVENKPDMEAEAHPLFQPLLAEQNPLIRLVTVERYLRVAPTWKAGQDNSAKVIAKLRNQAPLVIEQPHGAGRVVAFLTTAAPDWNSWASDPTFVVVALKLQSYLARPPANDQSRLVGAPLALSVDAAKFRPEMKFITPGGREGTHIVIDRVAKAEGAAPPWQASIGEPGTHETDRAGIYEAVSTTIEGQALPARFAFNVEPREGELALADSTALLARLAPAKVSFTHFDDDLDTADDAANHFSLPLMALLIVVLIGEQLLSYSAGYHPQAAKVRS